MALVQSNPVSATNIPYVDAVLGERYKWAGGIDNGRMIITTNFVSFSNQEPDRSFAWEDDVFFSAMVAWERVANIDLRHVDTPNTADIRMITGKISEQRPSYSTVVLESGEYAYQEFPRMALDQANVRGGDHQSRGYYNTEGTGWTDVGTKRGGYGYWTAIHELGHGLGLYHPFETIPSLDDGVFSVMSYAMGGLTNGWYDVSKTYDGLPEQETYMDGTSQITEYGYVGGPGPLDIAAIQSLYGANKTHANQGNVYELRDTNGPGTFWETIWDTGGVDEIRYDGAQDVRISLEPFSLDATITTSTSARWLSQAKGVLGGFIIADDIRDALADVGGVTGVVIENATGGGGSDQLRGNAAANIILGNAGKDTMIGGAGNDQISGGSGVDTVSYEGTASNVSANLATGKSTGGGGLDILINVENLKGGDGNDSLTGDSLANALYGNKGADSLSGASGNDNLFGDAGNDVLIGGLGKDALVGGLNADRFDFNSVKESVVGANRDQVTFVRAERDKIDLSTIDADTDGTSGNQKFAWIGSKAFSGVDGQLRFASGILQGDLNGDKKTDFEIKILGSLTFPDIIL